MQSYKDFKKGFLNEWVDRSQAARKAAEELAMKDITTLSDRYKEEGLVFTLDGHKVEFKAENEKNPNDPEYNLFTYEEALKRFGEPDKDGWRLPTKEELEALINDYPYEFDKESNQGVFDNRLSLPAAGRRNCNASLYSVGSNGFYWSSTFKDLEYAWCLFFYSSGLVMDDGYRCGCRSVRLIRDVK